MLLCMLHMCKSISKTGLKYNPPHGFSVLHPGTSGILGIAPGTFNQFEPRLSSGHNIVQRLKVCELITGVFEPFLSSIGPVTLAKKLLAFLPLYFWRLWLCLLMVLFSAFQSFNTFCPGRIFTVIKGGQTTF